MSKKGFGKFLAGASIGAFMGVLFAPKKGSETRKDLKETIDDLIVKLKEVDLEEVKDQVEEKIAEIQNELANLDKEKVIAIAKEKGKKIQKMSQELVDYAVEKGTPVLKSAADSVKEKAIIVVKEVLDKLENKPEKKAKEQ